MKKLFTIFFAIAAFALVGEARADAASLSATISETESAIVLMVTATGSDVKALEVDHSVSSLPEFTVYADTDPYGSEEQSDKFTQANTIVAYTSVDTHTWVMTFNAKTEEEDPNGAYEVLKNSQNIKFYFVLRGEDRDLLGSMYGTRTCNTLTVESNMTGELAQTTTADCKPKDYAVVENVNISGDDKTGYVLTLTADIHNATENYGAKVDGIVFDISPEVAEQSSLSMCWKKSNAPYKKEAYCLGSSGFVDGIGEPAKIALDNLDIDLDVDESGTKVTWNVKLGSKFIETNRTKTFTVSNVRLFYGNDPDNNIVAGSLWSGTASQAIPALPKKTTSSGGGGGGSRPTTPTIVDASVVTVGDTLVIEGTAYDLTDLTPAQEEVVVTHLQKQIVTLLQQIIAMLMAQITL